MKRTRFAILVTVIFWGSFAPHGVGASDHGPVASSGQVAHALAFRTKSGFRSDFAYVERSFLDTLAFPNQDYGVPLTSEEGTEVARRIGIQLRVDPVIEAVAGSAAFGGVWMDQAAGAVPVFQITFLDAAMVDQVSADLAGVVAPRFEIVAHSRSDLVSLKNRIWADRSALADAGIIIQSAALDIRNNRVELGVVGLTPTQEVILADRYDGVEVIDEALRRRTRCM